MKDNRLFTSKLFHGIYFYSGFKFESDNGHYGKLKCAVVNRHRVQAE